MRKFYLLINSFTYAFIYFYISIPRAYNVLIVWLIFKRRIYYSIWNFPHLFDHRLFFHRIQYRMIVLWYIHNYTILKKTQKTWDHLIPYFLSSQIQSTSKSCCFYCQNISSGILLSHKKEWNNAICNNMDGPRDYHTKWSKPGRER